MFKKATKEQAKLRFAIHGPSGAGKTYSALSIATHLVAPTGQRIAVLDTERGSASKYARKFDFDVNEVTGNYHPDRCIDNINGAVDAGYGAIIIDSGTHFWNGDGGFLQLVDQEAKKSAARGGKYDSFGAWKAVDPIYQRFVQRITSSPIHVFITLRAKQAYEKVESNGKTKIEKLGLAPQMRDDFQYEFDIEGMLTLEHDLAIGKTRCDDLDGKVFHKPGKDVADILLAWLTDGAPAAPKPDVRPAAPQTGVGPLANYLSTAAGCESNDSLLALWNRAAADAALSDADRKQLADACGSRKRALQEQAA